MTCIHDRSDAVNCKCKTMREREVFVDFSVRVKLVGEAPCDQSIKDLCRKPLEQIISDMTCQDVTPLDDKVPYVNMESAEIVYYDE